jgi:predicted dehydrogenase
MSNRREFFRGAGATLAAAWAANSIASEADAAAIEPMKAGVFGLDYSFWSIWADLLSPKGRRLGTSTLRLTPTHVWDKDSKKAHDFAARWGCEVVDRYDGMLGKVDVVLNGELNNVPWQHLLLRPYLEAGVPCFLQRPWSDNLVHLDEMLDLSAKHSTPVMATVPFEHYSDADTGAARIKNIGEIQAVFGTAQISDEPHFHLPYMLMKILGYDVESVSMSTDDVHKVGYLNVNHFYPRAADRRPFVSSMSAARSDAYTFTVMGERGAVSGAMPAQADNFARFFGTLLDIQRSFEKRALYQPLDVIRKKFQCVQAAYYSRFERAGAPVKIAAVPADWPIAAWTPNWYDGSEFHK